MLNRAMNDSQRTIQYSTVTANLEGLIKLLQADNKLYLLPEIQKQTSEYQPDDEGRVPLVQVTENIKIIADLIDDENFGCKVVNSVDLNRIPLFSTLSQCSLITERQGSQIPINVLISLITRYFSVITEVASLDIHFYNQTVQLTLLPSLPDKVSHHQIEGVAVGLNRIITTLTTSSLKDIQFTHGHSTQFDYKGIFSVTPTFSSNTNTMVFSCIDTVDSISKQMLYTASQIQRMFDHEFPETDDRVRCQHIIKSILSFGEPTREHVSDIMNISVSTLQRKLRHHNTNFKELLLNVRKNSAHDLLINHKRTPSELAFLLGYQSSSQFFKAFKTWFAMTPTEYAQANK